jgi:hypothetical protein
MDVLIRLEREGPPAGTVFPMRETTGTAAPVPFVGWLGLLRVLAEIVGEPRDPDDG